MKQVWKFPIKNFESEVRMPYGSTVLAFRLQGNMPTIWVLVDPKMATEIRRFFIVGTGQEIDDGVGNIAYVGTVEKDSRMRHLFERLR